MTSRKVVSFSTKKNISDDNKTETRETAVDLNGLLSVLGKHLYSTHMVALRELVQNAHDSIIRRRLEDTAFGPDSPSRITVTGDFAKGIIRIIDTGAGLTPDEVHKYLATVGVGYTRTLREQSDDSGLIGMFGLGFLSAFVLSTEVFVTTTSYQNPEQGWQYHSLTGEAYTLTPAEPRPVGTEVKLVLREEYNHIAGPEALRSVLGKYCVLLREQVYVNDAEAPLNPEDPPWRLPEAAQETPPVWLHRKQMDFADRFDPYFKPLCVIPIRSHEGDSDLAGLLWVQDGGTYGTSDNRQISVFGRGMLLNDDARDLLPHWAGFVSGVIESNHLTPTASREDLQKDNTYYAAKALIEESLVTGLAEVSKRHSEAWRRVLARHNEALLGASLCDERLFELLADSVNIRTSQGEMPASALRAASGTIHVRLGSQGGFEDMLFRVLRTPVARGDLYAVVPFLRKWVELRGGSLVELGTEKGNRRLFTRMPLPDVDREWLAEQLTDGEDLVPARFLPEELPLVVVHDREAELKKRLEQDEADKRISSAALRLARNYTAGIEDSSLTKLYVNLANPAVRAVIAARRTKKDVTSAIILLRSLKVIIAAGGDTNRTLDVNTALGEFCRITTSLAEG